MKTPRIDRTILESIVPHKGDMLLLTDLVEWGDSFNWLTSRAIINTNNLFYVDKLGGVPIWVGFEYMAQTIAALSGLERYLKGSIESRIGFIMGVRNFISERKVLPTNSYFEISVYQLLRNIPVVSFKGHISFENRIIATGTINAYEPERTDQGIVRNEKSG